MRFLFIIAIATLGLTFTPKAHAQVHSHPVNLSCSIEVAGIDSSGNAVKTECTTGGFPYLVPNGWTLCVTHGKMNSKYAHNPFHYQGTRTLTPVAPGQPDPSGLITGDEHTMQFYIAGFDAVNAHAPESQYYPAWPVGSGQIVRGLFDSGMAETQWCYGLIQGYLIPAGNVC